MATPRLPGPSSDSSSCLSALLSAGKAVVLDGALATYLESLGADISGALWSADLLVSNPSLIYQTHLDYFRAGANVAITSSYQASIPGLINHLHITEGEARELVRKSVQLAKKARDDCLTSTTESTSPLFIAGSVGPYGAYLANGSEYRGDYSLPSQEMKAFHRGRIESLAESGVDVLAIETLPSFPEAEVLLDLLRTEFRTIEAWFSFTLKDVTHISDGTPLSKVVELLEGYEKVIAVGVNCVTESLALPAVQHMSSLTRKPLIVYPNSGEAWNASARSWQGSRTSGSHLADRVKGYWHARAQLIGGCCRTTPEDIAVISQTLSNI
ncbi:Homocysteine S-methyltransferase [Lojkania enalia]|uniref:Homocysteine S-methyltransferase n=1 Tax=Lojkania enalia TaxID=147567 RepID=A0A9P4N8R9_9PLEO|nr:Homocysteine S-methyltransferase [Didymosphaeria enalia]